MPFGLHFYDAHSRWNLEFHLEHVESSNIFPDPHILLTVVLEFTLDWRCMTPHTYVVTSVFVTLASIYTMFIIIVHLVSLCLSC